MCVYVPVNLSAKITGSWERRLNILSALSHHYNLSFIIRPKKSSPVYGGGRVGGSRGGAMRAVFKLLRGGSANAHVHH